MNLNKNGLFGYFYICQIIEPKNDRKQLPQAQQPDCYTLSEGQFEKKKVTE